jgi:ribosomal protein L10
VLEDVICLVFIEYYLEDFAEKHEPQKVVDILHKTLKKMSPRAIEEAGKIPVSERIKLLLHEALKAKTSAT